MRKAVTILLTLALPLMILGLGMAVPDAAPLDAAVAARKREYQPKEFDFLLDLNGGGDEDAGPDFGDDDPGVDFGDDDPGVDFEDDDPGVDFGDDDPGVDFGDA